VTLPVDDGPPIRGLRQALGTFQLSAPLHPVLVHFTIALTSASLAFDLAGRVLDVASLAAAGWWTMAASAVVTLGTVISGITSRIGLPVEEGEARSYLRAHMALGPMFFGLLIMTALWRADIWYDAASVSWWYLAALGIVVAIMTVQGFLGGELVYRYGMDVRGRYRSLPVVEKSRPPAAQTRKP
jgi:uncharacterized membrane protein